MKNKVKLFLAVVFVSSFLAACGNKEEEKVQLNMAWWGSQVRHDATVQVIEMYEKENPHVSIEYEFYDYEGYYTKLGTLAASNDIWDIFQLNNQFPQYINQIEPLDEYVEKGIIDVSDTDETYLATTTYDDQLVGLSNGVNSFAIAYNKEVFTQLGIPEPSSNWTWDEFEQISYRIREELGMYAISRFEDFIVGCIIQIPQVEKGLNFYNRKDLSSSLGFDEPDHLKDFFELRKNLVKKGAHPEPGGFASTTDLSFQAVRDEKAAMVFLSSNQLTEILAGAPEEMEIGLINPPRRKTDGESGIPLRSSQMLSVSKNSKHKEEAAKFIDFFQNSEEANQILKGERGVPIMSKIREQLAEDGDETLQATFDYLEMVSELDNGEINVFDSPLNPEIQDQYNLLVDKVIYEEMTAQEAAESMFDFASRLLE
ncbi:MULTISPECIES: extracellular solute-binding protein [unclassified Enterococcus]|uniref:ABC transporter substrate-binding protein n=1 Tax=unclassified Enterococcus TaxID=2608891 RepID=UPI0013EB329D|nr:MULTISPECIES: extracellular solute-binding protein [unclassified Enterococcus]